jgi:hypothetical protein
MELNTELCTNPNLIIEKVHNDLRKTLKFNINVTI